MTSKTLAFGYSDLVLAAGPREVVSQFGGPNSNWISRLKGEQKNESWVPVITKTYFPRVSILLFCPSGKVFKKMGLAGLV